MPQGRIILSLLLMCAPLAAQAEPAKAPDLEALWRTGSLWEVGDNTPRVRQAREAIVDAGEDGLTLAMGKLGVSNTLEIRCLRAVVAGFGQAAVQPLTENIAHTDPIARRNVAELLLRLDARSASVPLLAQAQVETSSGTKLAQLSALAGWKVADALPALLAVSRDDNQRIRHRAAEVLKAYSHEDATERLMEMLNDAAYYVRDAAQAALQAGDWQVRAACLARLESALDESDEVMARRLMPVVASLTDAVVPWHLRRGLAARDGATRAAAAQALADWKTGAGMPAEAEAMDVEGVLRAAQRLEADPFARAEIEAARRQLAETR